jgi:hypothetical protein
MRNSISKAIVAGLTGLTMSAAVVSWTTPASAVMVHGGGFGGGGWHGGGFGGGFRPGFGGGFRPGFSGGVHPGFQAGFVGFRPGFRPGFVDFHPGFVGFHRRFFHPVFVNGVWVNGWWGGYSNGCWDYRPVYDAWGNFLGQSYVNFCH